MLALVSKRTDVVIVFLDVFCWRRRGARHRARPDRHSERGCGRDNDNVIVDDNDDDDGDDDGGDDDDDEYC